VQTIVYQMQWDGSNRDTAVSALLKVTLLGFEQQVIVYSALRLVDPQDGKTCHLGATAAAAAPWYCCWCILLLLLSGLV
jgi:hypothetical protein